MNQFDFLVRKQIKVMEELLLLQSEIEKCQQIESRLQIETNEDQLKLIQAEILLKKASLKEIYKQFDFLTQEVIENFQNELHAVE